MEFIQENVSALAGKFGVDAGVITKFLTDATAAAEVKPFADSLCLVEVFKPDDLATRIGNERKAAAEEAERNTKGNTFGAMDKRILDETGIAKKSGESTIDYMARAAKEKFGKAGNESDEMQRLRTDLEETKSALKQRNTDYEQLEVKHATEAKQLQINGRLDAATVALNIDVPADRLESQRRFLRYEFEQKYTADFVDGKEQITDKATGKVMKHQNTQEPMSAAEVLTQFAPSVVSLKKQAATSGSGFQSSSTNLNDGDASSFDFAQYATKEDFAKALNKAGISSGSKRGGELYEAFEKARPDLK